MSGFATRAVRLALAAGLAAALAVGAGCKTQEKAHDLAPVGDWRAHVIEVSAEGHAAGEYTLQDAFNDLPETGGTIALGEGEFSVANATVPQGRPVVLAGQGPGTVVKAGGNWWSIVFNPTPHLEVRDMAFSGQEKAVVLTGGEYGHIKFHRVRFSDLKTSIDGRVSGPVQRLTVTECVFENVHHGAFFRIRHSRNLKVSRNEFLNVKHRAIILGAGKAGPDNRYAEITHNTIVNMEHPEAWTGGFVPGPAPDHVIGILSYVDDTLIAHNTIKNVYSQRRHEAISSRGSDTVIRDNTIVNAGGHTAAISLASSGPTVIENNVIRFTDEHKGRFDGMDLRQRKVRVVGNEITGTRIAVHARRGVEGMVIEDNRIGGSSRQTEGVRITLSTGGSIPETGMAGLTVRNNRFYGIAKEEGDGGFEGVRFHVWNHRGDHDTRVDDVVISGNVFEDIDVADGAVGVHFTGLERDDSGMRNVRIVGNDFGGVDVPVSEAKRLVEDLVVADQEE